MLGLAFTSCSKSNLHPATSPAESILNTLPWKLIYTDTLTFNNNHLLSSARAVSPGCNQPESIQFRADGSFEEKYVCRPAGRQSVKGNWSMKNDSALVISLAGAPDPGFNFLAAPVMITKLTADTLQLSLSTHYFFVGKRAMVLLDSTQVVQTYIH
jgi:hypothetical protein